MTKYTYIKFIIYCHYYYGFIVFYSNTDNGLINKCFNKSFVKF